MALVPLLVSLVLLQASGRAATSGALYRGFAAGLVYFAGTLYWLPDVMVTFGGLPYPLALLAALLLIAYLALYPAIFAAVVMIALARVGRRALWLAPFIWIATEYGRGHALTGFPWVPLGNSQIDTTSIAQVASIVGVYGLSGLVAGVSSAIAFVASTWTSDAAAGASGPRSRPIVPIVAVAAAIVMAVLWGHRRVSAGELVRAGSPVRIGLAQGNVAQGQKWDRAFAGTIISRYLAQSREAAASGARLIVWPESATPFAFEADPAAAGIVQRLARETGASLLVGSDQIERTEPPRYYNSAYMLQPDGEVSGVYRKMHLVPFGEYVPFQRALFFVGPLVESVGGFSAGETLTVFSAAGGTLSTGDLLRSRVSRARPPGRAAGQPAPVHHHQRRLVRPQFGAVAAFRPGAHAHDRTGPISHSGREYGHQRHRRSLWPRRRPDEPLRGGRHRRRRPVSRGADRLR